MPTTSNVKEFVNAMNERRSPTTKALDELFTNTTRHQGKPYFADLDHTGALDVLKTSARSLLTGLGLGNKEFNHINKWPKAQKEKVRKALVHAINNVLPVRFFWEFCPSNNEETEVPDPLPTAGTITIIFRSPQKRVRVSTAIDTFGEILVDVGAS